MHRIDGAGATVDNKFTEGNPAAGIPATTVTAAWLNAMQEESVGLLEAVGIVPDVDDNTQLRTAAQLHVENIAALRALPVPDLAAGRTMLIHVRGYYAESDGGGGDVFWSGPSNEADDGGAVFMPTAAPANGRWKRIWDTKLNFKQFGAYGNGLADDTAAVLATVARVGKGGVAEGPKGVYNINQRLRIKKDGQRLVGASNSGFVFGSTSEVTNGAVLYWTGAYNEYVVTVGPDPDDATHDSIAGAGVENFQIIGAGNGNPLRVETANNCDFKNLVLKQPATVCLSTGVVAAGYGGSLNWCYRNNFENIMVVAWGAASGIELDGSTTNGENTTFCTFKHIHVTHANGTAWHFKDMDDCIFISCGTSREAGGTGDSVVFEGGVTGKSVSNNWFLGLHLGASDGSPPRLWSKGGTNPARRNWIFGLSGEDYTPNVQIDSGSELYYTYNGRNSGNTPSVELPLQRTPPLRIVNYDSSDPNALDWYEEGNFAPTLTFGGASTGIAGTLGGRYTRIGRLYHFSCVINLTNKGSAVGNAAIAGLPFAASAQANVVAAYRATGMTAGVGDGAAAAYIANSTSSILLMKTTAGSGGVAVIQLTDVDFTNASNINITGTCEV